MRVSANFPVKLYKVKCAYCKKTVERVSKNRSASCFGCKQKRMREYNKLKNEKRNRRKE